MAANNTSEPLPVGTWVSVRNSGFRRARIVEYRGPLGPGGARIYRIRVGRKPTALYPEVREDQLIVLPAKNS
jgi:hypothetical protein